MKEQLLKRARGFTLVELLVVIAIIGLLSTLAAVAFNSARMGARDAVRSQDLVVIRKALAMYLNDSPVGYPPSTGECLNSGAGAGADLMTGVVLPKVPVDPLWPTTAPADANSDGIPDAGQTNFCYFYFSDAFDQYKVSYFFESNSKAGSAGIHTDTQ